MQIFGIFEFFFEKNSDECLELHFCMFGLKSRSNLFKCVKIQKLKVSILAYTPVSITIAQEKE